MSSAAVPVVCLAHGSRHPEADATVVGISRAVAELTGREVAPAYLDFSPLTPTTVAGLLAAEGHREAVVVPLLFTTAFHMTTDVPQALTEATAETGVALDLAAGIGTGDDLADLLAARIAGRDTPGPDHVVLYSVGSSVAGANDAVADLAAAVGRRLGVPGHAVVATGGPGTGPEALVGHVGSLAGTIAVEPLFICPGTLWGLAVRCLEAASVAGSVGASGSVLTGEPLATAVAPLVVDRIADRIAEVEGRTL